VRILHTIFLKVFRLTYLKTLDIPYKIIYLNIKLIKKGTKKMTKPITSNMYDELKPYFNEFEKIQLGEELTLTVNRMVYNRLKQYIYSWRRLYNKKHIKFRFRRIQKDVGEVTAWIPMDNQLELWKEKKIQKIQSK
jgi:hypothetical protein